MIVFILFYCAVCRGLRIASRPSTGSLRTWRFVLQCIRQRSRSRLGHLVDVHWVNYTAVYWPGLTTAICSGYCSVPGRRNAVAMSRCRWQVSSGSRCYDNPDMHASVCVSCRRRSTLPIKQRLAVECHAGFTQHDWASVKIMGRGRRHVLSKFYEFSLV